MNNRISPFFCAILTLMLFTATSILAAPAEVPQSGQTTVYSPGDDGSLRTGADWPSLRFTVASSGEGNVVTDELTGLMWPQNGGTPTVGSCTGGARSWQAAFDYVACLNAGTYLGYSDWRLPNINELKSLAHAGQADTASWMNAQGFASVQSGSYWSSTSCTAVPTGAWSVSMSVGYTNSVDKTINQYVLPVRTGHQSSVIRLPQTAQTTSYVAGDDGSLQKGVVWPSPRFTTNSDTSVTDELTGLVWAPDGNLMSTRDNGWDTDETLGDGRVTWQHALGYISKLNAEHYLGYDDWRLPNLREMSTLTNFGEADTATWLNMQGLVNAQLFYYWSSSTNATFPAGVWYFPMLNGWMTWDVPGATKYIWPVRAGRSGSFSYLTISKTGTGTGQVNVDRGALIWSGSTGTASYGSAMTVNITATPDSGSIFAGWSGDADCSAGQLTMANNKNCTATFAILLPITTVSPAALSFANRAVNTISAAKTVTLSNTGTAALLITGISMRGMHPGQFSKTTTCPTGGAGLAAGASCTIRVKFKPTWAGAKSAFLAINVEAPAESKIVTLTGTGLGPTAKVSRVALSFANRRSARSAPPRR
jgi:hypothetical protein